jgi:NADPH:quinone reductase-like Zn-dependent oxidoreductase
MYDPAGVKTLAEFPVPQEMKAWVLGNPDELLLRNKPTPVPARAEVLVRIDAVAICATDLEIIHRGSPASILGGLPFNKDFTPGHEYMGTVAALGPGVDEFAIGERVSVESMPAAASASDAARACTPPASTTEDPTKVIAPTASRPTAASPNTPSITSTRWRGCPMA